MADQNRQKSTARRSARSDRPAPYAVATISLWDKTVGAIAEDQSGRIVFEYDDAFRSTGFEISPIHLPLSRRGPIEFPELRRTMAFAGLPGVLADSLPDAFGNVVIKRYFEQKGRPDAALSPVQKLLYIGQRAMGALEFHPAEDGRLNHTTQEALDVSRLVLEARRVIEGDTSVAVPEMMQVGASAGGARAKALVLWNSANNQIRSAFATPNPGDEQWLIKFDGVTEGTGGPEVREDTKPGPFGRIEYVYAQLARSAGIDMAETYLLRDRNLAHFMTKRFDRVEGNRLHLHSLGGLQHVDYNERGAYSYEAYFRTLRVLGFGQPVIDEAYRRMIFNVAAVNQDDHVKNIAFLMDTTGRWRLSPAYDMTFAKGNSWTRTHQMTIAGKDDLFTRDDLLNVGAQMDVHKNGAQIIEEVMQSLSAWEREAEAVEVPQEWITHIRSLFRQF